MEEKFETDSPGAPTTFIEKKGKVDALLESTLSISNGPARAKDRRSSASFQDPAVP